MLWAQAQSASQSRIWQQNRHSAKYLESAPACIVYSIYTKHMFHGTLEGIFIAPAAKAAMQGTERAHAMPGLGLEGDRYALKQGTFYKPLPEFELTLIEAEALEAFERDYNVKLALSESRRNLVTRHVPLNHLVGSEFTLGEVRMRGLRLCEPCSHLEGLVGRPVIKGLRHRGGLRAQILNEGTLRTGDAIAG
jgi:MOSC domain-containing protein YiiM